MNDTPETDAQLTTFTSISKLKKHFVSRTGTVNADFARKLERERDEAMRLLEIAWGVIANAGTSHGKWESCTKDWQEAAIRWRDDYFKTLKEGK